MKIVVMREGKARDWIEVVDENIILFLFVLSEVVVLLSPFREHVSVFFHVLAFLSFVVLLLKWRGISLRLK